MDDAPCLCCAGHSLVSCPACHETRPPYHPKGVKAVADCRRCFGCGEVVCPACRGRGVSRRANVVEAPQADLPSTSWMTPTSFSGESLLLT